MKLTENGISRNENGNPKAGYGKSEYGQPTGGYVQQGGWSYSDDYGNPIQVQGYDEDIQSEENVHPGDGTYQFSFQTENGISRNENGSPKAGYGKSEYGQPTGGYVQQGGWSYSDDYGNPIQHPAGYGKPFAILSEENVHPGDGTYQFSFQTENGISRNENGSPNDGYGKSEYGQPTGGYVQQGGWSYSDGYGNPIQNVHPGDGTYQFGFQTENGISRNENGNPKAGYGKSEYGQPTGGYVQQGGWSYSDDYGNPIQTENGISRNENGSPKAGYGKSEYGQPTGGYAQQGGWSYSDGYGKPIQVTFVADENGYQPSSDILPTPTENGISRNENGSPKAGYGKSEYGQPTGGYVQQGGWSYSDGYGNPIQVTFVADENGYQPSSDILPTPTENGISRNENGSPKDGYGKSEYGQPTGGYVQQGGWSYSDDYGNPIQTENGISRNENGSPKAGYGKSEYGQPTGGYVQQGGWSYSDGYGNPIKVTFVADENGYQPSSDILPTPVPTEYPLPIVPQTV
ncbi:prisilkin-39-like [Pollicipes pollicipes]|uniref:prisilkin-39-like n=1 Tax=Pollicipes pollicipes TaxID=41117 RepID=UPI001884C69C|nr:prisilkin-39-like [Pollicipes pollicipes]